MTQRQIHRKGNLTKDRIQSLEVIGFIWCRQEHAWDEMYQRLVSYHQRVTFGAGLPKLMVTFNHSSQ
jgi:hypothetical protein